MPQIITLLKYRQSHLDFSAWREKLHRSLTLWRKSSLTTHCNRLWNIGCSELFRATCGWFGSSTSPRYCSPRSQVLKFIGTRRHTQNSWFWFSQVPRRWALSGKSSLWDTLHNGPLGLFRTGPTCLLSEKRPLGSGSAPTLNAIPSTSIWRQYSANATKKTGFSSVKIWSPR